MAADYREDILAKARDLKMKHPGQKFNPNFVTPSNLRKIAERFTSRKKTNVDTINSLKKVIQYMIAAKMVGDRRLYNELNEYTMNILDNFCSEIEIVDDCGDGFDTAVQRHVYRANPEIYEYLKANRIKYIDAGLVKFGGTDIFIPSFNALICIVGNRKCFDEIADFIKNTPEEDRHNDIEFTLAPKVIKDFYVFDGKIYVTTNQSNPIEDIKPDTPVIEYLVDAELDPDDINMSMFTASTNNRTTINTYRQVPLSKLKNGTKIMIKNALIYIDNKNHYKVVGHYELLNLIRYEDLNTYSLIFSYPGLKGGEAWIDTIRLTNLSLQNETTVSDWSAEYGNDKLDKDFLYLFKGKTRVGQINYRETVSFEDIKELLDQYIK